MTIRSFRRARARRLDREYRRLARAGQRALVAGATLGASAVFASSAQAAGKTYTVLTSTDDNGSVACTSTGGSTFTCPTLRDAISAVTTDTGGDTITFDSGLNGQTISLGASGELGISVPMTIETPSGTTVTIDAHKASRVFDITAAKGSAVSISGLTIENGQVGGEGGGIDSTAATLTLTNDTVTGSTALGVPESDGGGVYSDGPLTISDSHITNNTAQGFGGGVEAKYDSTIENSTIANNTAKYGGGVSSDDSLTVTGSQIIDNTAANSPSGTDRGGGILVKYSATITDSTVSGNTATTDGGGIEIGTNETATAQPISVSGSTIASNSATNGAGIEVGRDGSNHPITISASTISGNTGSGTSFGGGILIDYTNSPFELIDSTISGNGATNGGGVSLGNSTSGQLLGATGAIAFDNSTIAANSASASGGGGGIWLSDYSATTPPTERSGTANLFSTIVGRNTAAGAENDLAQASGSQTGGFNASYSLIQQPGSAPLLSQQAVIKGVDPQLGALGNNGGPTQTMLPAFTSPVIDQGKDSPGLKTDQRGDPRTVSNGKTRPAGGDGTDIGAVEIEIPISVVIEPATGITSSKATLNGQITTNGAAVTWYFEWGKTTAYGHLTPTGSIPAGTKDPVRVSFTLTGLTKGTVYHYRLLAKSPSGASATSADAKFKTLTPTIKVQPGIVLAGHTIRLSGSTGGCPAGDRVTLLSYAFSHRHEFAGVPAVYATAGRNGRYATTTRIPMTRAAKRYSVTARCGGANFGVTAHVRVVAPPPPPPKPQFTG